MHLIGETRVISGITHYDERCKLACAVFNLALAHLLLVGVEGLLDELLDWIEPRNTVIGYNLPAIPALGVDDLRTTGYVLDTLQAALWAVLYCDEFEEGLLLLINNGGDTDTAGAVGGALLGAQVRRGGYPRALAGAPGRPNAHRPWRDAAVPSGAGGISALWPAAGCGLAASAKRAWRWRGPSRMLWR